MTLTVPPQSPCAALVIACGCGRIAFDPLGTSDTEETNCTSWGAWSIGDVILVGTVLTDPTETGDRKELHFARGPNPYTLGMAIRADVTTAYGPPSDANVLDAPAAMDTDPAIADDGLSIMFASDRSGSQRAYEATRLMRDVGFSPPTLAVGLEGIVIAGAQNGGSIAMSGDGLVAYVPTATTLQRFTRTTRASPFVFAEDYGVLALYPSLSRDELELYYNCNTEICRRTRTSTAEAFGAEELIDLQRVVADPDLSSDGTSLLFQSSGSVYRSTRSCAD